MHPGERSISDVTVQLLQTQIEDLVNSRAVAYSSQEQFWLFYSRPSWFSTYYTRKCSPRVWDLEESRRLADSLLPLIHVAHPVIVFRSSRLFSRTLPVLGSLFRVTLRGQRQGHGGNNLAWSETTVLNKKTGNRQAKREWCRQYGNGNKEAGI